MAFDDPYCAQDLAMTIATVKYNYKAQQPDELSLTKGARISVLEKSEDGWWKGELDDGVVGWFPSNYVNETQVDNQTHNPYNLSHNANANANNNTSNTSINNSNSNRNSNNHNLPSPLANSSSQQQQQYKYNNTDGAERNVSSSHVMLRQQPSAGNNNDPHQPPTSDLAPAHDSSSLADLVRDLEQKLNLTEKVWYHGVMSRQQCDQLLNAYAEDGDFLVRNSETSAGDFSVSLKAPVRNKHFRVHYVEDGGFCVGQRKFATLDELVEHYKRTPIYTSASGERMFLKKPY